MLIVERVGFLDGEARPRILDDELAFPDGLGSVAAFRVDFGMANDEMGRTGVAPSRVAVFSLG